MRLQLEERFAREDIGNASQPSDRKYSHKPHLTDSDRYSLRQGRSGLLR